MLHPLDHLYHWTFHLIHISPSEYPQFKSIKKGKHSGILHIALRLLSLNHKHSRPAGTHGHWALHSRGSEPTWSTWLWWGGHRRGYQPGRICFNDVECFGSESGAQQSNDTLVELLEDGDQIPKGDLWRKWEWWKQYNRRGSEPSQ